MATRSTGSGFWGESLLASTKPRRAWARQTANSSAPFWRTENRQSSRRAWCFSPAPGGLVLVTPCSPAPEFHASATSETAGRPSAKEEDRPATDAIGSRFSPPGTGHRPPAAADPCAAFFLRDDPPAVLRSNHPGLPRCVSVKSLEIRAPERTARPLHAWSFLGSASWFLNRF